MISQCSKESFLSDRIASEFYLIRYVPDVVKGEFVNIGVIFRILPSDIRASGAESFVVRFTRDWKRVLALDPDADIELLESFEADFAKRLKGNIESSLTTPSSTNTFLGSLLDTLSNSLQITEPNQRLSTTAAVEVERLMRMYVE